MTMYVSCAIATNALFLTLSFAVERANTNQELLQAEIDALNNPPTTTSPLTTSGNGVLAFSFWTIFVLQCVMAFAHY